MAHPTYILKIQQIGLVRGLDEGKKREVEAVSMFHGLNHGMADLLKRKWQLGVVLPRNCFQA